MVWPIVRPASGIFMRALKYQKITRISKCPLLLDYYYLRGRIIHTNSALLEKEMRRISIVGVDNEHLKNSISLFDAVKNRKNKEKDTFLDILHTYTNEPSRKTGHVQFMYAAMRYMDEFGLQEDLEIYKAILDILPKGRLVCKTLLQAEFMHFPREQQCAIDLLEKMEDNGVIPDPECETMVINLFGEQAIPLRKLRRMAYWMGKFKNLNPWPIPKPLPTDAMDIAQLAIRKIASVDVQSKITVFDTKNIKESIDKTWIVSASSPDQEKLISKHPKDVAIYVEGPFRIWVSKASVDYFLLRSDALKKFEEEDIDADDVTNIEVNFWKSQRKALVTHRCIHEQDEQTIFGVCATGTSSKDSLLSWIRCLQPRNPDLEKIPILFKFTRQIDEFIKIADRNSEATGQVSGHRTEEITS